MLHRKEHRTAYQDRLQQFKRDNYHASSNSPDYVSDYRPFTPMKASPLWAADTQSSENAASPQMAWAQGHQASSGNPAMSVTEEQKKQLLDILSKNGVPTQNATLLLEISSVLQNQWQQRCTMTEQDIQKIFEAFGEVTKVVLYEQPQPENNSGSSVLVTVDYALITFKDTICAYFAQSSLNGHYLQGQGQQLKVQWMMPSQDMTSPPRGMMINVNMSQLSFSSNIENTSFSSSPPVSHSKPVNLQDSFMKMTGMNLSSKTTPQKLSGNMQSQNHESSSTASSSSQSLSPESHDSKTSLLANLNISQYTPSFTPTMSPQTIPQSFYPTQTTGGFPQTNLIGSQTPTFTPTNIGNGSMIKEPKRRREGFIKYNCKFFVQIENDISTEFDKPFGVCRRVIGPKGQNMKKIIEEVCQKTGRRANDVKLRLRGIGSGFKESPNNEESQEPLHLCISSKYIEMYNEACDCAEELLEEVYQQYSRFCNKNMRTTRGVAIKDNNEETLLKIKKEEIITGPPGVDLSNIKTKHSPASAPAKICKQLQTNELPRYATNSINVSVLQQNAYEAPVFQPTIKPFVPSM